MLNSYCSTKEKRLVKVGDKVVGSLEGNKFTKSVEGSRHKLRCPPAWAIDAEAFDLEIGPNATEIAVIDKETGLEYSCSVETFDRHSFRFNRGFADQYALPLHFWHIQGNRHKQLSLWEDGGSAE